MHHEIGVSDRRSFLRYVGQLALAGLGVGMLARPAFASSESEQLACTCCVNCQACNCSTCTKHSEISLHQSRLRAVHVMPDRRWVLQRWELLLA